MIEANSNRISHFMQLFPFSFHRLEICILRHSTNYTSVMIVFLSKIDGDDFGSVCASSIEVCQRN